MATRNCGNSGRSGDAMQSDRRTLLKRAAALGAGATFVGSGFTSWAVPSVRAQDAPAIPEIPQVTINFASLPAIDHTHIVIPVKREWNKDVGIEVEPDIYGSSITAEKFVSALSWAPLISYRGRRSLR